MKRALMLIISLVLTIGLCPKAAFATVEQKNYYHSDNNTITPVSEGSEILIAAEDALITNDSIKLLEESQSEGYTAKALSLPPNSEVEFAFDVKEQGGYGVILDYYVKDNSIKNLAISLEINGEYQFSDSRNIELYASWKDSTTDYKKDDFGNDIFPQPVRIFKWETAEVNSSIYNLAEPLRFNFKSGKNTIKIKTNDVACYLGNITLQGQQKGLSFLEYKKAVAGETASAEPILIEGEHYSEKSESFIRGGKGKDYNRSPYDPTKNLINYLQGETWAVPGNSVSYTFTINTPGVYYINLKYCQSEKTNMHSFKQVKIDGEYLFDEMKEYPFEYTGSRVVNHTISINNEPVPFYFTPGEHTFTIVSTASPIFETYENLLDINKTINDIALQIKVITGNKSDKNRDWEIDQYIPTLKDDLLKCSKTVLDEYNKLLSMSSGDNVAIVNNLKIASTLLNTFAEDLNFLVNNLDQFSQGNNSVSEYVSLVLPALIGQPMDIDQITITPDISSIPAASKGFWGSLYGEAQKLLLSFFIKEDTSQSVEKDQLNIWANRSVTHLDVLREMSYEFQENENVKVNLSVMPDEQKLLLAVSSGNAPDAVIGATNYRPFDFALRGAIKDLREFDDFKDTIKSFHPEMFIPFIIEDSCYALPETANFQVLYYRKDIMNALNLQVPKTWNEVVGILPTISRYGMDFNTMIANVGGIKHFGATIPFIQQYGGKVYSEDGSKVLLGDPKTVEAFTLMTDLYTKYSLPESIPNFYNNFKKGITPIGISDLQTYILLVNAAPEIAGQWGIASSIGVESEDGTIKNFQPAVNSCNFILNDAENPQQAWDFIKWYMSDKTQSDYANQLQLRYGPQYIWNTANLNALSNSIAFTPDDKKVILDQLDNTMEIPRNPAYFAVERELSNAWNSAVFDGQPPRTALDSAITKSNREIEKKLKEFGYMDSQGNLVKPFTMATAQTVLDWANE